MPKIKAIHELRFSHPKTGEAVIVAPGKEATVSAEDAKLFLAAGAATEVAGTAEEEAPVVEAPVVEAPAPAAPANKKDKAKKDADKDLI